jgi:hypothetical protein
MKSDTIGIRSILEKFMKKLMKLSFFDNGILTKSYGVSTYIEKKPKRCPLWNHTPSAIRADALIQLD